MLFRTANITQLSNFDNIVDVRSPAEYKLDHIPGAVNYPVLDDLEHARIGTLYKQSAFEARRLGAALIARHVADLLDNELQQFSKDWMPLIYCSRGGMRSWSISLIMASVGFRTYQLTGGYKSYRQHVLQKLPEISSNLILKVICGPTGSGKSHLLDALKQAGQQVLDLEKIASHRGSVLGNIPNEPQPAQRYFDSNLLYELQQFDLSKPVFIESESRRIGNISIPDELYKKMHLSECLVVEVPQNERVNFLCNDYNFYLTDPELLIRQLSFLEHLHSSSTIKTWKTLALNKQFAELVRQLLEKHYDPLYWRSMRKHYPNLDSAQKLNIQSLSKDSLKSLVNKFVYS